MPVGNKQVYDAVCSFLKQIGLEYNVEEENHCDHFRIKTGAFKADLSVFTTGKILLGGPDSPLRKLLENAKADLMMGSLSQLNSLPAEIEKLPETLKERIQDVDEVIVSLVAEAIRAFRADILIAASFLLGAASEKAILLMVEAFATAIDDEKNRESFNGRIGKANAISRKYEEFMKSYKSCKTRCADPALHDWETILNQMFHVYRINRNDVGHPQIIPNLDRGIILANLAAFYTYINKIYALIDYFSKNKMIV